MLNYRININAEVAELVDAHDSNSCAARRVGSIPTFGTNKKLLNIYFERK